MVDIAIVGEAWGEQEERERTPFVGPSGYLLSQMLEEARICRADCFLTNVFNLRPKGGSGSKSANSIENLCGPKESGIGGYPALVKGKYVRKEYENELDRLGDELLNSNPNIIICLGNTATWALRGQTAITKLRGTSEISSHTVEGFKIIGTYHPAAILRQWNLRPITVIDLIKAKRESAYPNIRRPKRTIYIPETVEDIHEFFSCNMRGCAYLAVDIETAGNQITCIGLAPRNECGLVIPFVGGRSIGRSYWSDESSEREVWRIIKDILGSPRPPKVFQNGLYDIAFLWRAYGIKVYGAEEDTMLLHHALQPESLKGLAFLGSIYTDEGAWKDMRKHKTTIKQDD